MCIRDRLYLDHIDWEDPALVSGVLYVGGVGSKRADGSGTTVDAAYITEAQERALIGLRRDQAPKVCFTRGPSTLRLGAQRTSGNSTA